MGGLQATPVLPPSPSSPCEQGPGDISVFPLASLNDDILQEIFGYFVHPSDWLCLRRVCKRFFTLGKHWRHLDLRRRWKETKDRTIAQMAPFFPSLKSLNLHSSSIITNKGIRMIADHCKLLQHFDIAYSPQVTDEGLYILSRECLNLEDVDLTLCTVTDKGLEALATGCRYLRRLVLTSTRITDVGLERLAEATTALVELNLTECRRLTSHGVTSMLHRIGDRLECLVIGSVAWDLDVICSLLARSCPRVHTLCFDSVSLGDQASLLTARDSALSLRSLSLRNLRRDSGTLHALLDSPKLASLRELNLAESLRGEVIPSLNAIAAWGANVEFLDLSHMETPEEDLLPVLVSLVRRLGNLSAFTLRSICLPSTSRESRPISAELFTALLGHSALRRVTLDRVELPARYALPAHLSPQLETLSFCCPAAFPHHVVFGQRLWPRLVSLSIMNTDYREQTFSRSVLSTLCGPTAKGGGCPALHHLKLESLWVEDLERLIRPAPHALLSHMKSLRVCSTIAQGNSAGAKDHIKELVRVYAQHGITLNVAR
eukprot:gnl/Trimastix_PCT/1533.p1 GENE.gnl/Trimastix_PCT/1533~~gnl/Trimastix_PCT/1533.p1  ORF type:complete len:546 (+),score=109.62 gnl/Trimastix_PCT/1533:86-1723(+)